MKAQRRSSGADLGRPRSDRRGATMVETAIVLMVFLTLVFGMIELAVAVLNHHIVTQAARQLARTAIVHGKMAPPELDEWSPATLPTTGAPDFIYEVPAEDEGDVAKAVWPYLAGVDRTNTTISLQWLEGTSELEKRVRAKVVTTHEPFLTFIFTSGWTLTGESTMPIAH